VKKADLSPLPPVARSNQLPYPNIQSEPEALSIQKACSKPKPLPIHPKLPSYSAVITRRSSILLESIPTSEFPKKTPPKGHFPSGRVKRRGRRRPHLDARSDEWFLAQRTLPPERCSTKQRRHNKRSDGSSCRWFTEPLWALDWVRSPDQPTLPRRLHALRLPSPAQHRPQTVRHPWSRKGSRL